MDSPYFQIKEWSQEELDLMIAKAVKPLQEQIDVLERSYKQLAKAQTKDWNELVKMIQART